MKKSLRIVAFAAVIGCLFSSCQKSEPTLTGSLDERIPEKSAKVGTPSVVFAEGNVEVRISVSTGGLATGCVTQIATPSGLVTCSDSRFISGQDSGIVAFTFPKEGFVPEATYLVLVSVSNSLTKEPVFNQVRFQYQVNPSVLL